MKIYIDVGHGESGTDTGATGTLNGTTIRENEQNLRIALAAEKALTSSGHTVTLSRRENKNITELIGNYSQSDSNLIASAGKAKSGTYGLMVSIHNNSSDNPDAKGYQLFYKTGNGKAAESKKLAESIGAKLSSIVTKNAITTSLSANGEDFYGILRLHDKVGVLCECSFMTNSSDLQTLYSKADDIGKAVANGINDYIGVVNITDNENQVSDGVSADYKALYEDLRARADKAIELLKN